MNNLEQSYSDFLLQLDKTKNKEIYAKVIALTFDENPTETIEGRITAGSINVDGASAVRRTCSLTIVAEDFDYSDYIWGLNTKFKLEIGVKNTINSFFDDIIWFQQGVFVLTSFNISRSTTNFSINLSGKDKMCLLNGENGGVLESSIDFGTIQEENKNGEWEIKKIPIPEIIRNAVHVYGKESYHNIIINDLDILGRELLEYRYDIPMYLYRSPNSLVYTNILLNNDTLPLFYGPSDGQKFDKGVQSLTSDYLESLVTTLTGTQSDALPVYTKLKVEGEDEWTEWYFTKINPGDTAGYRITDLTYAGDLIAKVGESLTSILDKIKNMLVEYEYFYNLDGQFVFQKKKSFVSSMWSASSQEEDEEKKVLEMEDSSPVEYTFSGTELIINFNNNPNIANLKNDFSIWGERQSITGVKIPIHLRYAIDKKPIFYKSFDDIIYTTDENEAKTKKEYSDINIIKCVDWREIIFQMAKDYYQHNMEDDFEYQIGQKNPTYYPTGRTGYEIYYTDLQSFWRELYYPTADTELSEVLEKFETLKEEVDRIQIELYGRQESWSENNVGGLQNDLTALNNFISEKKDEQDTRAEDLVLEWNNAEGGQKHNIKNGNNIITDVNLYLSILQDLYFRQQSIFNSKTKELNILKQKKEKLENNIYENYYIPEGGNDFGERNFWNRNVYENPALLNFWFDFLDSDGTLGQYGVSNLSNRSKAVQDSNVKSIYFRDTPQVIFKSQVDDINYSSEYRIVQIPSIENMFTISAQGKSAKEKLDELLYQHTCVNETATITTIPIYYLQPNTKIKILDNENKLNGDYIINKITIPLTYNGTMSLQVTKTIESF